MIHDPLWLLGLALYWGEGAKRSNQVHLANSDVRVVRVFILWLQGLGIDPTSDLSVQLHVHAGQDAQAMKSWWSAQTGIPIHDFIKPFVKPEGTGHRTNHLYYGTVRISVRRSTDLFHRIMGWIDGVGALVTLAPEGVISGALAELAQQRSLKSCDPGSSPGRPTIRVEQ